MTATTVPATEERDAAGAVTKSGGTPRRFSAGKLVHTYGPLVAIGVLALVLMVWAPNSLSAFRLGNLGKYCTWAIAAVGIGLAWGRGGMLVMGQGVFFGLGAYSMAMHLIARPRDYDVIVSDNNGPVVTRRARLVVEAPRPGRLVNLSVRATARGPGFPLIVGAAITGGSKFVLVRGLGPALATFGVTDAIVDPRLDVHGTVNGTDTILASNNDWGAGGGAAALRATFSAVGDLVSISFAADVAGSPWSRSRSRISSTVLAE